MRDLAMGMSGPDVRALQEGLNTRSEGIASPIAVDGVFGPDQAVRAFQKRQQLDVDGVVGRETRPSIFHLALLTATIFGQKINSGQSLLNPPSLKDRVIAGVLSRQAAVRSSSGSRVYAEDPYDSRRHEETNDGLGDSPQRERH